MKRCSHCGQLKPLDLFYVDNFPRSKTKKQSRCIECAKEQGRQQYHSDPKAAQEKIKAWKRANPEKVRAAGRRKYQRMKERVDPELRKAKAAAYARAWRAKMPSERKYRGNAERLRRWFAANPGRQKEYAAQRRTAMRRRLPWADPNGMKCLYQIARIYRDAGISCEVDHIIPLKGAGVCGLHVLNNLQLLPKEHNRAKGRKLEVS